MIINNTFGFIFVHVPKTAGTTLTSVLSRYSTYCDIEVGGTALGETIQPHFIKRYGLAKHSTAREIRAVVGEVFWKKYFSFAFVRNPYARAFSAYKFLMRTRKERQLDALDPIDGCASFDSFVESDYFRGEGLDRILMPQAFWLRRGPRDTQVCVDYVGKVETIESSLEEIRLRIPGLHKGEPSIVAPILNRSNDTVSLDFQTAFSSPAIEQIVFDKYHLDFELFGYERMRIADRQSP